MWKTKKLGGIKLVNLQLKSEVTKAKWILDLTTNPNMTLNLKVFSDLIGQQEGNICGRNIFFLPSLFLKNQIKVKSLVYKEGFTCLSKFNFLKGVPDVSHWDNEHLFHNKLFTDQNFKTFKVRGYCKKINVWTFKQLLDEKSKENRKLKYDKALVRFFNSIVLNPNVRENDIMIMTNGEEINLSEVTQKLMYEELLFSEGTDHHSQAKWVQKLNTAIEWDKVWSAIHNFLPTNHTKTTVWQQLHINFYTQYSYNKWHKTEDPCPLCNKLPESIYHIILHCDYVIRLWLDIEPTLRRLHPTLVTEEEMAFGLAHTKQTTGVILRNWITYSLRAHIMKLERQAYHSPHTIPSMEIAKYKFSQNMALEIKVKIKQYKETNPIDTILTHSKVLCEKLQDGEYRFNKIFI